MWLAVGFFFTALIYATVGFGGGSTYTAFLSLADVDPKILPVVSLLCNVVVVSGGSFRYAKARLTDWTRILPLVAVSAPLAWLGGLTPLSVTLFKTILGVSLLAVAAIMAFQRESQAPPLLSRRPNHFWEIGAAAGLGYLAGLVGIGGGIFLAPLLHFSRWGSAKAIAAAASMFILVNSLFGLGGQISKLGGAAPVHAVTQWWPLMVAVLVGGQIGSYAGVKLLSLVTVRRLTALLVLYAGVQLLWKLYGK